MRDMDFLKSLGNENDDSSSGSMINGMTAEQYAASLDSETADEAVYSEPPRPSAMGGSLDDLSDIPLTEISDMDAPSGGQPADGISPSPYGGSMGMGMGMGQSTGMGQTSSQPAGFGTANRYSADSYTNTTYTAPETDFRTVRQRQIAAAASNENIGMGIIGGILGAALGTIVWALISWAGYISWIGAVAIVAGCFFGYLFFAKDIGRGGALVVCILIIAAVFCGNRLGFAILLHSAIEKDYKESPEEYSSDYEVPSTLEIFKDAGYYIDQLGMESDYNSDMITSYIFTGIASAAFFVKRLK